DQVIGYWPGRPKPSPEAQNPEAALGVPDPDADHDETLGVTLGCRGTLAVAFRRIALYDGPGADLHIFEVGDDVEQMAIEVSSDGQAWIPVGEVRGQPASIDFAGTAATGSYRYVRITDRGKHCDSEWPGADIDAVGAINAR
ncbi:MAG TPA: hypothetical protein VIU61_13735, partial [Kofleriaceae bacterium]